MSCSKLAKLKGENRRSNKRTQHKKAIKKQRVLKFTSGLLFQINGSFSSNQQVFKEGSLLSFIKLALFLQEMHVYIAMQLDASP